MNSKRRHITALTVLAACVISCVSVEQADTNAVRLRAGVFHPEVKAADADGTSGIMDADYAQAFDIKLVRIDENSINSLSYPFFKSVPTTLDATVSEPDAEYMRNVDFATSQYYRNNSDHIRFASWYPTTGVYSSNADSSSVSFNVDGATDIMYGSIAEGNRTDGFNDISFNHALCQFNVYAYKMVAENAGATMQYDWGHIEDLIIKDVESKCVVTLPKTGDGKAYRLNYSKNNLKDLVLKDIDGLYWNPDTSAIPDGFGSKQKFATYLAPPPTKGYLNLKVHTSSMKSSSAYQQISIARNFQAGCAYDIILRFTSHGFVNAEVSIGKWNYGDLGNKDNIIQDVAADMYYDLSAYYTANCYIIPSGNYGYSFTGNVRGNDKSKTINPEYIDILWSDNPDLWSPSKEANDNYVRLASHTLSRDRIMVRVGDVKGQDKRLLHEGNVVIAAYDNATNKNILWTWHLWFNKSIENTGYTNGFMAMDRNLGAATTGGEGLYYQWGRKDPFSIGHFAVDTTGTATIDETIAHPTTFYGGGSGTSWYSGSAAAMNSFWGWTSDNEDIKKSVYDPCPAGYHVPDYRLWGTANIAANEKAGGYETGVRATVEIANSPAVFNLSMGYLNASGTKVTTGTPLFMWSSSMNKTGSQPYAFYYPESGRSPLATEEHRNYGGSIRCISKSASVVKDLSAAQTSNCYIISKDGYYKFKANIPGNGASRVISSKGNDWDITGSQWGAAEAIKESFIPAKVDYLWYQPELSTKVPDTLPEQDICLKVLNGGAVDSEGYATISVEDWVAGNFILAAYDKYNNIIWSWHFWLTDEPADEAAGSYTTLDRNIGATMKGSSSSTAAQALASYGFFYQWGRKDPFPGAESADAGSIDELTSSAWFKYDVSGKSWSRKTNIETQNGQQSTLFASQNPTCMILNSSTYTNSTYHWMTGYTGSRINNALWGYAIEADGWGTMPGKSCYDPCPVGYKVANHLVFWGDEGNRTMTTNTVASGSYGYTFTATGFENGNWYPNCGRRNFNNGYISSTGSYCYLFTSVSLSGGRYVALGSSMKGIYQDNSSSTDGNLADAGTYPAYAHGIRCMKM